MTKSGIRKLCKNAELAGVPARRPSALPNPHAAVHARVLCCPRLPVVTVVVLRDALWLLWFCGCTGPACSVLPCALLSVCCALVCSVLPCALLSVCCALVCSVLPCALLSVCCALACVDTGRAAVRVLPAGLCCRVCRCPRAAHWPVVCFCAVALSLCVCVCLSVCLSNTQFVPLPVLVRVHLLVTPLTLDTRGAAAQYWSKQTRTSTGHNPALTKPPCCRPCTYSQ